jgi:hypothetical protein
VHPTPTVSWGIFLNTQIFKELNIEFYSVGPWQFGILYFKKQVQKTKQNKKFIPFPRRYKP